ncbi:Signal recognition particle receptor FtsY [Rhodococcus sp. RD6.2]|uniref:signal recognition particle-docking protein FtsY n=1 Tax=Rhodococcus sp. RD6.2 TaxID=260936 RepID=UPI00063B5AFD|nr:signal recognition particle-docking protein FtsY [Rhodococcus sp. RD6.2]CRK54181.1 Signal recognition particle receptor FtsY [Rhodococcus sp. RD6.2]
MTTGAWIAIAAVLAVLIVALVAGTVLYRKRQVSLTPKSEQPEAIGEAKDRSGGYKSAGGFSFSQGATDTAPPKPRPEPVTPKVVEKPIAEKPPVEEPPVVEESAAAVPEVTAPPVVEPEVAEPEVVAPEVVAPEVVEPEKPEPVVAEPEKPEPVVAEPEPEAAPEPEPVVEAPAIEEIAPTAGRLDRLRGRLSRSQNAVGKSLLGLLGGGDLDDDSWEEIEDTLIIADLGSAVTEEVVGKMRAEVAAGGVKTEAQAREMLRRVLIEALHPEMDRSIRALPHGSTPGVLLVVGVNGTGKTTSTGKLARVLVADGRRVLLGAADTFRAAAADQLQTWAERVGAEVVRGAEGADPAAIAFDSVSKGIETGVDVVIVDTAGRLHTKTGLMDELGKVKRVVEKRAKVDEVLLVLDSTIGQNGLVQARVFAEVVDITGVVLTKLDGTAKGGIVFQVQHELGVPVKLVGLGEGADDLAPFEPDAFVDALLG